MFYSPYSQTSKSSIFLKEYHASDKKIFRKGLLNQVLNSLNQGYLVTTTPIIYVHAYKIIF